MDITTIQPGDRLSVTGKLINDEGGVRQWRNHRSKSKLQHDIWSHGNELLLRAAPSQQDMAVALIQFQRAVELRDKLLDRLYVFEQIPGRHSSGKYAVMTDLGIIRPTLKVRLRDLRNMLMHNPDAIEITRDECDLLADTAWYYLRVTDRIAEQYADEIEYEYTTSKNESSYATLKMEPVIWSIEIDANLSVNHLSIQPEPDTLDIEVKSCTYERYSNSLKVKGKVTGSSSIIWSVVKTSFEESRLY